jgi:5-methylcytosine-specific restriction endonuclease McrBC regulatory subunit McrC
MPDIWLEWESTTLIADAKYKRHWEELREIGWAGVDEYLRDKHRTDLLQVLAYANLARTQQVIACLIYPCSLETWTRLRDLNRLLHRAEITAGSRRVKVWLTAIPISSETGKIADPLVAECQKVLRG